MGFFNFCLWNRRDDSFYPSTSLQNFLLTLNSSVLGPLLYLHWLSWWPHPVSWPWIFICWWLPNIISSLISSEAQAYSSSLSQYTINISITDKSWLLIVLLETSGNSIPIAQPPNHGVILDLFPSQLTFSPSTNPISLLENVEPIISQDCYCYHHYHLPPGFL